MRELGRIAPHARSYLRPEQAVAVFGAAQKDLDTVKEFADKHSLEVQEESVAKRLVRVAGPVEKLNEAFGVELRHYEHSEGAPTARTKRTSSSPPSWRA